MKELKSKKHEKYAPVHQLYITREHIGGCPILPIVFAVAREY
jgi:hypothetical protein